MFQPHEGQTACIGCDAGTYAADDNATACQGCSVGHFCPDRAIAPQGAPLPASAASACYVLLPCPHLKALV